MNEQIMLWNRKEPARQANTFSQTPFLHQKLLKHMYHISDLWHSTSPCDRKRFFQYIHFLSNFITVEFINQIFSIDFASFAIIRSKLNHFELEALNEPSFF